MNLLFLCLSVGVEDDVPAAIVIGEDGIDDYKADNNASKDNSAAEYLIKKWIIPKHLVGEEREEKEASMIDLFHQEFGTIVQLLYVSNFCHLSNYSTCLLFFRFFSKSHRYI